MQNGIDHSWIPIRLYNFSTFSSNRISAPYMVGPKSN